MYRTDIFKRNRSRLCDYIPWARIIPVQIDSLSEPITVVINKDGSLQTSWEYHGPDLDSTIQEELAITTLRLQESLSSIPTDWVLYFEAQRLASSTYPEEEYFPDPVTKGIDSERKALFTGGRFFESKFIGTAYWMPPPDRSEKIKEFVVEGHKRKSRTGVDSLEKFVDQITKIQHAFIDLKIPIHIMSVDETLTYLHSTISDNARSMELPKHPLLLDSYICDAPLYGGLEPVLNNKHIRVISPIKYPKRTSFGFLNALNHVGFPYRWSTRCFCLSKGDDISTLDNLDKQWSFKLQSVWSYLFHKDDPDMERYNDVSVMNRVDEIKEAKLAVEEDTLGFVYYSTAIIVMDEDLETVEAKAKIIRQLMEDNGFKVARIEDINAVDAWFGCIPGKVGSNIRRPLLSTGNFVHMMPLSSIWAGPERNRHLNAPPLLFTKTDGNTPFRLSLHIGQVGHTLLVGPTGAGKSVHLCCIEAAFRRYKNARVIIFDNGASSKVLTYGVGGCFYDLGNETDTLSFQPLAHIDDLSELQWAQEWLIDFLAQENITVKPDQKSKIRDSLGTLAGMPSEYRTITNFINFLQDSDLKLAFYPLAQQDDKGNAGEYGNIFDSDRDTLEISDWQTFEMGKIMQQRQIIGPTLMYIFHRIENNLKGFGKKDSRPHVRRPTLIVLDECWMFFDNPLFAAKIEDWLRTLRKYDASVVFATQSLEDIVKSPLLDIVLGSCPSHIFLPDDGALELEKTKVYQRFKLNKRQIEILASSIPQKHYYYTSPEGSRRYDLALEHCPFTLSYVATGKEDIALCDRIIDEFGAENFNEHWLKEHKLSYPEDLKEEAIVL